MAPSDPFNLIIPAMRTLPEYTRSRDGLTQRAYADPHDLMTSHNIHCPSCGSGSYHVARSVVVEYDYFCRECDGWFGLVKADIDGDALERLS